MEVTLSADGNKNETSMSTSSEEVSIEKTDTGTTESRVASQQSLQQSVQAKVTDHSKEIVESKVEKSATQSVQQTVSNTGNMSSSAISESSSQQQQSVVKQSSSVVQQSSSMSSSSLTHDKRQEIQQEDIKKTLNEIISDIDTVIEQEEHKEATEQANAAHRHSKVEEISPEMKAAATALADVVKSELNHLDNDDENKGPSKKIDLDRLFTPATDADEIQPGKNRKLYASSSFYSPNLHPTVEDQVQLAKSISDSLADANNKQSKGQSMFVNRKKRSVKWVHEGGEHRPNQQKSFYQSTTEDEYTDQSKENSAYQNGGNKVPLKLVMGPRQMNGSILKFEQPLLSPELCVDLVNALNAPKGKGAELFAKRRKRSENWIVDDAKVAANRELASCTPTAPTPAFSDAGVAHTQRSIKFDSIQEKYQQPRVTLVKSPWDAALETGSVENAFLGAAGTPVANSNAATPCPVNNNVARESVVSEAQSVVTSVSRNSYRDLAYKTNLPQGWGAPPVKVPNGFYLPPEIPACRPASVNQTTNKAAATESAPVKQSNKFQQSPQPQQQRPPQQQQKPTTPLPSHLQSSVPKPFTPIPYATNDVLETILNNGRGIPSDLDPPKEVKIMNLADLNNYNRAPRGWGQCKDYYRPVTFKTEQQLPFTDF